LAIHAAVPADDALVAGEALLDRDLAVVDVGLLEAS